MSPSLLLQSGHLATHIEAIKGELLKHKDRVSGNTMDK